MRARVRGRGHELEPNHSEHDACGEVQREAEGTPGHSEHLGERPANEVGDGGERSQPQNDQEVWHRRRLAGTRAGFDANVEATASLAAAAPLYVVLSGEPADGSPSGHALPATHCPLSGTPLSSSVTE